MKIIIFGGNGFIGKNIYNFLIHNNHIVKIYGNIKYSLNKKNLINYSKKNFIQLIKKEKPNSIFFLSGNSYPNNSGENELYDLESNNFVLQQLLASMAICKFKGKFFYTSSIAVYGSYKKRGYISEESKLEPESFYGLSKVLAEIQIKYFSQKFNVNSTILRLCSVYGPGLKKMIVYKIIKSILFKKKFTLNGNINDSRQFIYIDDCVKLICALLKFKTKKKFNIYNIAQGKKVKIISIIKYIKTNLKKNSIKFQFTNKLKSPNLPALSNKKVLNITKYKSFTNIYEGIDLYINKFEL